MHGPNAKWMHASNDAFMYYQLYSMYSMEFYDIRVCTLHSCTAGDARARAAVRCTLDVSARGAGATRARRIFSRGEVPKFHSETCVCL
jgi:hypothetical protein